MALKQLHLDVAYKIDQRRKQIMQNVNSSACCLETDKHRKRGGVYEKCINIQCRVGEVCGHK